MSLPANYKDFYSLSIKQSDTFWKEQAKKIDWFQFPNTIQSYNQDNVSQWYEDGKLNLSYLCVDKHVKSGKGNQVALYYDSPVTGVKKQITFKELQEQVATFAGAMQQKGLQKGDIAIIYMPMIPEAIVAMLACARLGVIHSVVFGGFAAHELEYRINDSKPKILITATCGIEVNKIIDYKTLVDEAVDGCLHKPEAIVIYPREQKPLELRHDTEINWYDFVANAPLAECVSMNGNEDLYLLYTSGTTGNPKGVVRQGGGYAVNLYLTMKYVYGCTPGDVYWAASDIGWVVGHSYIVYGPLLYGCSSIVFEGKPVKTPDPGTFWRIIDEYKVNCFFTAPTAFRAIKKEDPNAECLDKYDISSLRAIFLAGERLDPPTQEWLSEKSKKPIYDHWWQTESGSAIVCNPIGVETFPIKKGSSTFPFPGYAIDILDEDGNKLDANEEGYISIKLPLPPGCLNRLWSGTQDFINAYLSKFDGYYLTGDSGYIDEDGYVFIMGRVDDVINVAGHRLSTGQMEEIIASHSSVAECAVIGIDDELKGQIPVAFYIPKDGIIQSEEELEKELIQLVRDNIGAVAALRKSIKLARLPKTRSGKILRKTMRQISKEDQVKVPSTIDDPEILNEIKQAMQDHKIGKFA